jgi:hypothetical protein
LGEGPVFVRPLRIAAHQGRVWTVRYTAPAIVLGLASAGFIAAVALTAVTLSYSRTGPALLLAVALAIASFTVAAWAVGRIRRTRAITPESIITPPDESE